MVLIEYNAPTPALASADSQYELYFPAVASRSGPAAFARTDDDGSSISSSISEYRTLQQHVGVAKQQLPLYYVLRRGRHSTTTGRGILVQTHHAVRALNSVCGSRTHLCAAAAHCVLLRKPQFASDTPRVSGNSHLHIIAS